MPCVCPGYKIQKKPIENQHQTMGPKMLQPPYQTRTSPPMQISNLSLTERHLYNKISGEKNTFWKNKTFVLPLCKNNT